MICQGGWVGSDAVWKRANGWSEAIGCRRRLWHTSQCLAVIINRLVNYRVFLSWHTHILLWIYTLNVKKFLARNKRDIWNFSNCNGIWTHNCLVRKRTPSHLAKLAKLASLVKWFSVHLRTTWLSVRILFQSLRLVNLFVLSSVKNHLSEWKSRTQLKNFLCPQT